MVITVACVQKFKSFLLHDQTCRTGRTVVQFLNSPFSALLYRVEPRFKPYIGTGTSLQPRQMWEPSQMQIEYNSF